MAKRANDALNKAAVKVGTTLGRLAGRASQLDRQRHLLAERIRKTIAEGHALLERVGLHHAPKSRAPKRRGNGKGFKATPQAKARVRKSWKGVAPSAGHEHTKPDDVRAAIRATESTRRTSRQTRRG